MDYILKSVFVVMATFCTKFWGGFDSLLYAMIMFVVVDYITGVLAAIYNKTLNSYTGFRGIIKKILLLCLVGVAATLDSVMGLSEPWVRTAVIYFLLANEGVSILENVARAGIPIPNILIKVLEQIKDSDGAKGRLVK